MQPARNTTSVCFVPTILLAWLSSLVVFASAPVSTYGTYFGSGGETGVAVATDSQGNVIVVGTTTSQSLPGTDSAFQRNHSVGIPGTTDVFIAKFDPTGRNLLWTTFLGGNASDTPSGIATDASGNIYVAGTTQSSNFPGTAFTSGCSGTTAFQQTCPSSISVPPNYAGGSFIAKVGPGGNTLIYSLQISGYTIGKEYLGGTGAIAVTPAGTVRAAANNGNTLLLGVNQTGTGLSFAVNLGGGQFSNAAISSLVFDSSQNVYVAGFTEAPNMLVTANAYQNQYSGTLGGMENGFLIEINAAGSSLLYGTYFGPIYDATSITSLAVSSDGSVYIGGTTNATSFQATSGAFQTTPSVNESGFVAKLRLGASMLDAFTYLPAVSQTMTLGSDQSLRLLETGQNGTAEYVVLTTPTLALAGVEPSFSAVALAQGAASNTEWLLGSTYAISNFGGLYVTPDAFQATFNGSNNSSSSDAFLQQITLITPTISFIGSAATGTAPFAPEQLISIYGTELGLSGGSGAQLSPTGAVTNSNGGTQVLFDGVAAPILYAGPSQVNAVIPCSTTGRASTQVVISYAGAQSAPVILALGLAAPGIFTVNGSGSGQAAVVNEDGSLNGLANPASRGSTVAFYATGIGATSPCVDGQVYADNFPTATLPITVGVGGLGAQVPYSGQAPFLVSGAAQINTVIPNGSPRGSVSLSMAVGGGAISPSRVTIAVK